MQSLLKKAKAKEVHRKRGRFTTKEDIAIALAWAKDEITHTQVAHAYGVSGQGAQVYVRVAQGLKAYVQQQKV